MANTHRPNTNINTVEMLSLKETNKNILSIIKYYGEKTRAKHSFYNCIARANYPASAVSNLCTILFLT